MSAAAACLLAACQPGGPSESEGEALSAAPSPARFSNDQTSAFYVTDFVDADVLAARNNPRFAAQRVSVDYTFTGNPLLDGVTIVQNAFEAIRAEYAHSVGLTGAGQLVSLNDTSLDLAHPELWGKTIYTSGAATSDRFHGTAVASVLAGSAQDGTLMGIAPETDLHLGQLEFGSNIQFRTLARYFDDARALGAIASSNSWNLDGATFANTNYDTFRTGDRAVLIDAMRRFSQNGIIIFSVQNDFEASSVNALNGLPRAFPELATTWIAGMNAVPIFSGDRIVAARRQSAPCNEAAAYCIAANGTVRAANAGGSGYVVVSGTSFVAPQIAGAIAILAEAFPNLSARQLRDRLLATANNGWFTPVGFVEFAPGLVHGYSPEFGHGFIDLRAALLPIGSVVVPREGAPPQPITTPLVVGGGPSGDAVMRALAAHTALVTDSLGGAFATRASSFAAQARHGQDRERTLRTAIALDQRGALAARRAALAPGGFALAAGHEAALLMPGESTAIDFAGLDTVDFPFAQSANGAGFGALDPTRSMSPGYGPAALSGGAEPRRRPGATTGWSMRTHAPRLEDDSDSIGLGIVHRALHGPLSVELGLDMAHSEGSMLGIHVPGETDQMSTGTLSVNAGMGLRLAPGMALRLRGEWGVADGPGAGAIDRFEGVRFSSYSVALDAQDVLTGGDVLTLAARAPMAITGGHAALRLATGLAPGGGLHYGTIGLPLAPQDRQLDLALDYLAPLGRRTSFGVGLRRSWNAGHVAGERVTEGAAALQIRF
jgi:subtilisin family serine protease